MYDGEGEEDRLLAYESAAPAVSLPSSARTRLQGLGSGIVQRRYRMATESVLCEEPSGPAGIGLQSLSHSRMGTSPLINLVRPSASGLLMSTSGILSKSVSFQSVPAEGLSTRFIDDVKIKQHQERTSQQECQLRAQARRQAAYKAAASFAKTVYWLTILTGIFGIALSGSILFHATTSTWHRDFGRNPVYKTAAVASEEELCSKIGVGILKRGGNAVDATVATMFCIAVKNNFSSGLGGGGFMLVRVNATYTTVIDYRETAPSQVNVDDYGRDNGSLSEGGLSVAVPGQVKGLAMAHQRWGRLPWADLLEPSIALCEQGFPVTPKLAQVIGQWATQIEKSPAMRETYMKRVEFYDEQQQKAEKWAPKTEADIVYRPNLGRTLRKLTEVGPEAFWTGDIAEAIVAENRRAGGKLTVEDLAGYQPVEREPLSGTFKGFKVTTVGAPASGAPLLLILRVLEGLKVANSTSIEDIHKFVESLKFGYAARMHLSDPAFQPNVTEQEAAWLTEENVKRIVNKVHAGQTHPPEYYTEIFDEIKDKGTTHLTVLDRDGMAVSTTDTINGPFGSFIMDSDTGVLQNNHMDDFSLAGYNNSYRLPPSPANFILPGKRPVSSSTPIILEKDGQVVLVTGAAGGSRIISVTAQVIMDIFLFKQNPVKAMVDSRIHHQLFPNEVIVDNETAPAVIKGLIEKGHQVTVLPPDTALTSLQLILRRKNGEIWALSDPRKGGLADGY